MLGERFWANVAIKGDCHVWTGPDNGKGYGKYCADGRSLYAHRLVYESAFGSIPHGYHIDHICRNRSCVRLDHLEAVTPEENDRRAGHRDGSTCCRGHVRSKENQYTYPSGKRGCAPCRRLNRLRYRIAAGQIHPAEGLNVQAVGRG